MKRLYLASSINRTGVNIAKDIGKDSKKLKLAFITTAAEGSKDPDKRWLDEDKEGLAKAGFKIFDYTITNKNPSDFENDLNDSDVIHVNGGNSFYLLLQVKKSGFGKWIKKEVEEGNKIYIGSSAGAQVVTKNMEVLRRKESKIFEDKLKDFNGIGLVDFVIFPHWGSEVFKDVYFKERLKRSYKPENKIILLNNYQYVKVVGDTYKIVDTRDRA